VRPPRAYASVAHRQGFVVGAHCSWKSYALAPGTLERLRQVSVLNQGDASNCDAMRHWWAALSSFQADTYSRAAGSFDSTLSQQLDL
jgi:hypothetical protein